MKQNSELTQESGQWLISKTLQWVTFVYFLCALPLIRPCGLSVFECSDSPLEQQKKSGHSSASSSHPTAAAATKDMAGNVGRKAEMWRWIKVKAAGQERCSIHAQCSRNAPPSSASREWMAHFITTCCVQSDSSSGPLCHRQPLFTGCRGACKTALPGRVKAGGAGGGAA